ncbi:DUF885 domain-containing protein [Pendulispora brunnea]|uniref:DUF885 domain-containing protein n=1 Tax=Pendulispora brunnea TaxID=2905690 RepID=A0ABZ2KFM6_9BACT
MLGAPTPAPAATATATTADEGFRALERRYVLEFLRRNPTANTYLGGIGLDPSLAEADGRLRDHSKAALEAEDRWLATMEKEFQAAGDLKTPALRIDREVALAQIRFLLHQHQVRHYQERALDTYVDEPSRAVDFTLQGMTVSGTRIGTPEEWRRLAARLRSVGPYFKTAQENLAMGIASGRTPDVRMLVRNGLTATEAGVPYFETKFPGIAAVNISDEPLLAEVREASRMAAAGYRDFHRYVATTFFDDPAKGEKGIKKAFAGDRYAMGEAEYDWAITHNLRLNTTAARLFDESWPIVQATRAKMVKLAREIGTRRKLALPADDDAAVRAVFAALGRDAPTTNDEMFKAYRTTCFRLIDGARRAGLFDIPTDYRLDIMETPEPLRVSIMAAYYPAPPFKASGVGHFYMTPTDQKHQKANFHEMADLCAHEAFPGHDWHYKTMTRFKDDISPLRWLTPGGVEDSSSMWADSMAVEGWGVYAEGLMAEPLGDSPHGLLTPEEHLYVLRGIHFRDLRVRVDTGMHIGRLSYDDVVELLANGPTFLTGSCRDRKASPEQRSACERGEQGAARYARSPTQAITYRLGKEAIEAMRQEVGGDHAKLQRFHLAYMRQGTIPPGYFRDELLRELR